MARKVYTYTELNKLGSCSFWKELKEIPQIVVSTDMKYALKNDSPKYAGKWHGLFDSDHGFHAVSISELQQVIEGSWSKDINKFYTYSAISKIIRDKISATQDTLEKKWLQGCQRNVKGIYTSITRLEEAGLLPSRLDSMGDQNVELLKEIWDKLLSNNTADSTYDDLNTLRTRLGSLDNADCLQEVLRTALKISSTSIIKKIVVHGLFYMTAFQERLLDALEKSGVELIILIPYDKRYPFAYEIWKNTYGNSTKYEPYENWIVEESTASDPSGEIFEGRKPEEKRKGNIRIREYGSLIDFSKGIKDSVEYGNGIYSAGCSEANEIVKSFYPELYGERKLLAYPIGKFIWNINDMWDENADDICLSESRLLECFSSGWLSCDGYSGKDYVQDITDIMPFFSDCNTIADWEKRLSVLVTIEKNCIMNQSQIGGLDAASLRWHKKMGNPLSDFSQFSIPTERVKAVITLVRHLLSIARELFVDNNEISISDHIKRLNKILDKCTVTDEASELEREIAREILFKLNAEKQSRIKCLPADAAKALELFLEGTFDDDELKQKNWAIMPMYHVDSSHISKKRNWIHICLCDNDNMPGGKGSYPWPLNENVIKNCYEQTKNNNLWQWIYVSNNAAAANRYFMYSALKHSNVMLSWISEVRGKKRAESPYIGLISSAVDSEIRGPKKTYIDSELVKSGEMAAAKISMHKSDDLTKVIPKDAQMDYAVCPLRYLYGYLVDDAPRFRDEFMQRYSISSLIVAISNVLKDKGIPVKEVYKNVMELFPSVKGSSKREIYDYIMGGRDDYNDNNEGIVGKYKFGNVKYSEQRLRVHFPDYKGRQEAIKSYGELDTEKGKKSIKLTKPGFSYTPEGMVSKTHPCAFCPQVDICKYSVFPKDREKVYGNE